MSTKLLLLNKLLVARLRLYVAGGNSRLCLFGRIVGEWEKTKLRQFLWTFILALFSSSALAQATYQSIQTAQSHCPNDTVVWLNTRSDIYHFQGERWFGNTEEGAYVCERDADANGDRPTKNGQ
jgi:hypothetical protein